MPILTFDVIVIGSGSAGFAAVEAARAEGASVCLVEKGLLGGECPNWACVPSKALLKAAKVNRTVRDAQMFGVISGGQSHDWSRVMGYRHQVVASITGGGKKGDRYVNILERLGVTVYFGSAVFEESDTIIVDGVRLRGKTFVIATGTVEYVPTIPGLREIPFLSSREALARVRQPKVMAIIGGGPVGCEVATIFASFGTRVLLLQGASRLLPREDEEISIMTKESLERLGIEVVTDARILQAIHAQSGVYGLNVQTDRETTTHAVDAVVVAAGKRANVEHLQLTIAGVHVDERGNIISNREQRTGARNVFVAGDVDGGMLFTHTAHHEGVVAGHNAARTAKGKRSGLRMSHEQVVPRVTFVDPEVASVGLTADEAKRRFKKVFVGRSFLSALGRGATDHTGPGLVKIVADPKTRKIIGCSILSPHAGEMIHEAALAIHLGATVEKLTSLIHAYPTYSEGLLSAAAQVKLE